MLKVIKVHRRERLLSLDAIYGMAERLNELNLPRRQVIEWVTCALYGWHEQGGVILSGEGEEIEIYPGIVDDAHGDDPSCIWISQQRRRLSNPPKRRLKHGMLARMQVYDAAFRIDFNRSIIQD